MALCRLVSAAVRLEDVAKGPADCKARMSASWPSSLAVSERQRGVQSRLLDVRQQRRSDGACHLSRGLVARRLQGSHGGFGRVQPAVPHRQQGVLAGPRSRFDQRLHRRGLQVDRRRQVGGAGPVQERRGDFLIHVGPRLLGREVQSQLVRDGSQGVAGVHGGQGDIVGGGDRAVHGSGVAVNSPWTWRPPPAGGPPPGSTGWPSPPAPVVRRRDAALRGGEIGGQGVGGQIRSASQPRHLGLQRGDRCGVRGHLGGVGSDARGVGRRVREGRVGRQDRGQLAGRDAGDFGGPPIVQDLPGDGRLE